MTISPTQNLCWPDNPLHLFEEWFSYAKQVLPINANAMVLSSSDAHGNPDARVVLLKFFDHAGFVFFTHYDSPKGQQLALNPNATLVFLWNHIPIRQVRIYGYTTLVTESESDQYFYSRPYLSQLASSLSPQSQVIPNLEHLKEQLLSTQRKDIRRPSSWGGYRLVPQRIEFWEDRPHRMNERMNYRRQKSNQWTREYLAP